MGRLAPHSSLLYSYSMKVVIATGIYPPEIGGPSYYAKGLEDALHSLGHTVEVVVYGNLRRYPMGVSHLLYFFRIWPALRDADAVIALDTASVAIPGFFAAKLRGVPFIIRTGGDFVWEHYIERTKNLVPLPFFYDEIRDLSAKEHFVFTLTRFIVRRSLMVFSTEMQRDVWMHPYGLTKERTRIIGNAIEAPLEPIVPARKNFLFFGRQLALKNRQHFIAAFEKVRRVYPDIELDEGQIPKAELMERMRSCYAVVLPSVSEVSPNYIIDALRCRKPFIVTRYCGLAKQLEPYGMLVDPLDEVDMAHAIGLLATPEGYDDALVRASRFSNIRTYEDIAREFLGLIQA